MKKYSVLITTKNGPQISFGSTSRNAKQHLSDNFNGTWGDQICAVLDSNNHVSVATSDIERKRFYNVCI